MSHWLKYMGLALLLAVVSSLGLSAGAASARGVDIRVDLSAQRMQVTTPDGERYNWAISSGREGFRTPTGSYRAQRLEKHWHSRKYDGPMPHSIFFRGGYAIHGTNEVRRLGRPASHGCIRLAPGNAAKLFQLVQRHGKGATRVAIHGVAPDGNSQFAKARPERQRVASARPVKPTVAVKPAKLRQGGPDWATARGRILERNVDPFWGHPSVMGFQPIERSPPRGWMLR